MFITLYRAGIFFSDALEVVGLRLDVKVATAQEKISQPPKFSRVMRILEVCVGLGYPLLVCCQQKASKVLLPLKCGCDTLGDVLRV